MSPGAKRASSAQRLPAGASAIVECTGASRAPESPGSPAPRPRRPAIHTVLGARSATMAQTAPRHVPVNLRQTGSNGTRLLVDTRVRKSPFWHLSVEHGCWSATVYNHMYHPRAYIPLEEGGLLKEYEYLTNHVTLWNVAVERQIRIKGPDALDFADLLVTRDLHRKCPVPGKCRYVLLCDESGGIVNDPVLLRVAEDEIWLSISDSDVLTWARGVAMGRSYNVAIDEIDVSPLQIQGPKARDLMNRLVALGRMGAEVLELRYYHMCHTRFDGIDVVVSRTGFSGEIGYELYLPEADRHAEAVWGALMEVGAELHIRVIAPSHIRRLEAGILSYGQDMDLSTSPFEVGLGWQVDFDKEDFIGKRALAEIARRGVDRRLVGVAMEGDPISWYPADFYPVYEAAADRDIGYVTSAFQSPSLGCNIGLAMVPTSHAEPGTPLRVGLPEHPEPVRAAVAEVPFKDPLKQIPKAS
ncbi:glycine cleavage T C-terminal barrel domain-containing protein [Thiohalorhabdus sp. Cl-TMA]|uniref:Glycine cleavage T C-terminal barrel domain-containing protein n=1 Tax=Thiohalorhabdus methylotrophus TaxID=3242694 RepID=A0ABV4TWG1_9GAMM